MARVKTRGSRTSVREMLLKENEREHDETHTMHETDDRKSNDEQSYLHDDEHTHTCQPYMSDECAVDITSANVNADNWLVASIHVAVSLSPHLFPFVPFLFSTTAFAL